MYKYKYMNMDYHQCRCWSILYNNSHKQNKKQIREITPKQASSFETVNYTHHVVWSNISSVNVHSVADGKVFSAFLLYEKSTLQQDCLDILAWFSFINDQSIVKLLSLVKWSWAIQQCVSRGLSEQHPLGRSKSDLMMIKDVILTVHGDPQRFLEVGTECSRGTIRKK